MVSITVAGCALFGVFSWQKNGREETIEMKRSMKHTIPQVGFVDDTTLKVIEEWFTVCSQGFRDDLETYTVRYNEQIGVVQKINFTSEQLFKEIVLQNLRTHNLPPLNCFEVDCFGEDLYFPEGVCPCTYEFVRAAPYPLLGFTDQELYYDFVP